MPYKIQPDPAHQGRKRVVNTESGDVKGGDQDAGTALSQFRLLEAIEHDPDFKPRDRPGRHYGNKR